MTLVPSQLILTLLLGSLALAGGGSKESKPADPPPPQAVVAPPPAPAPALPECKDDPSKSKTASKNKTKSKAKEPECVPKGTEKTTAATPAAVAPAPASAGGYDLSKNKPVTDSTKAVAGEGTQVKGINDWEGEISGIPAANSRFTKLKIGMAEKEVKDLLGNPTDEGQYVTGKAFIPFYFGSDRIRWEMAYKGEGRLIFAQQGLGSSAVNLIWIIHNANDRGYR